MHRKEETRKKDRKPIVSCTRMRNIRANSYTLAQLHRDGLESGPDSIEIQAGP